MSTHWADKVELGSAWGLRFLLEVRRWLGRWPFHAALIPVISYYFLTQKAKRSVSRQYLERVYAFHGLNRKPSAYTIFRHFLIFGESILDKVLAWDVRHPPARICRHGYEALTDLLAQGRGAMLIGSHLGNMEIARHVATTERKIRVNVLVHTKHSPHFIALLSHINPQSQMALIQVSEVSPATAMLLKEKVDAGEVVLIAGDRIPLNGTGITWAPFLGHSAPLPIGPYVLASILECPVFLFFCLGRNGAYDVHFEPFTERVHLNRSTRREDLTAFATRYAQRLSHYCGMAPLLWGNFYHFWEKPGVSKP